MSRYIDEGYIKAVMINDRLRQGNAELTLYMQQVEKQVSAMPSIDIVRCQDCKHWVYNFNGCARNPCTEPWYATDFCSYGEREGE